MIRDSIFILGAGSVIYGIQCIYPPAAWIFGGITISAIAYFTAEPVREDEPKPTQ